MAASSKEKRVSVGGLAAVFDYIKEVLERFSTALDKLNSTVSTNKTTTDNSMKRLNDTVAANKAAAGEAIADLKETVETNKTAADNAIRDVKTVTLGNMTFSIDPADGGLNITYESEEKSNE